MKLQFPRAQIQKWAAEYTESALEADLLRLVPDVRRAGFLTRPQLHFVARWKSARSAPRILENAESYVREVTRFALSTPDERARIESLTILNGVSWPMASVVLHFFHSNDYPILDIHALRSVGVKAPAQYTFDLWFEYVQYCRKLSAAQSISMRDLDRALWQHSYNSPA